MTIIRFAAIGINHNHHLRAGRRRCSDAGGEFVAFHPSRRTTSARPVPRPPLPAGQARLRPAGAILDDPSIRLVTSDAGIPGRPGTARHRRDAGRQGLPVPLDKPGMTSLEQLAEVRRVQAQTGRI